MELFFSNWYPGPILLSSFLISPSYYILAFILTTYFHSSKFHNVTRAYGSYLLNIETGPCFFSSSFVIEENWFLSFFLFISFFFPNDSFKEFFKTNGLPLFLTVVLFPRDTNNTSYYVSVILSSNKLFQSSRNSLSQSSIVRIHTPLFTIPF